MPLLLASTFQHFKHLSDFEDDLRKWNVGCIITAALEQIDDSPEWPEWMKGEIAEVEKLSGEFFEYDIRGKNRDDLDRDLSDCDLIYFILLAAIHIACWMR